MSDGERWLDALSEQLRRTEGSIPVLAAAHPGLQGVGVLHLVRCGNPVWILKGCVEARSIPVDLVSATPKRAHAVNFGTGEGAAAVGASG